MKTWVRMLAICGLFVGLVAMTVPVEAQDFYFTTYAQTAYPAQYTDEVTWVRLCWDSACFQPISDVPIHTQWNYRTTTSYLDWHTGADGRAAMIRNIADATCGYTVRVDVFVGDAQQQVDSAYFTPCGNNPPSSATYPPARTDNPPPLPSDTANNQPSPQSSGPVSGSYGVCPAGYPIKANDNSGIYHVPGGQFYGATNARNCFATEAAAQAAGYRASYR